MAKNRKYRSAGVRFGPALKAFLLCLLIGGSAVGYVWQQNQIYELGQQKKARETQLSQLVERNKKLEHILQSRWRPMYLDSRIKKLGLIAPPPSQVWQLPEPAREPRKMPGEGQYIAKQ